MTARGILRQQKLMHLWGISENYLYQIDRMMIVVSAERNGLMISNTVYNTDLCTVINAKNGSQEPSIVRDLDKVLDVTGTRNVNCVKPLVITNE